MDNNNLFNQTPSQGTGLSGASAPGLNPAFTQPADTQAAAFTQPQGEPASIFSQPQSEPASIFSQPQSEPASIFSQPQAEPSSIFTQSPAPTPAPDPATGGSYSSSFADTQNSYGAGSTLGGGSSAGGTMYGSSAYGSGAAGASGASSAFGGSGGAGGFGGSSYTQPSYTNVPPSHNYSSDPDVSVGEWLLTLLLMCLPCVNIIMLLVWAFGNNTSTSKANWAKANLIFILVGIILSTIFSITVGSAILRSLFRYTSRAATFY